MRDGAASSAQNDAGIGRDRQAAPLVQFALERRQKLPAMPLS